MKQIFSLNGITCQSCANTLDALFSKQKNIANFSTDVTQKKIIFKSIKKFSNTEIDSILNDTKFSVTSPNKIEKKSIIKTYKPLFLVVLYLAGTTFLVSENLSDAMRIFMGGFFLIFSFFKFLDLKGFANSYRSYDLITKAWPDFGFVYPFLELGLGILYLKNIAPIQTNVFTLILMSVSIIGVINSVVKKQKIKCACLGTGFNLPMSTITIIEDGLMILMAAIMIFQ